MYIKRVELSNFKSFGGTTAVPLLPGFTVVSGPNGSGKSNILDALLFALGLSSSKGMRAERLPDLVNHTQTSRSKSTVEASVTVTFDLENEKSLLAELPEDEPNGNGQKPEIPTEWSVTRRLRVTPQGTYTSNYYINGEPCNLTDLHEQLQRLRIYPEGYNVVLQGDVTGIISMNPRERRAIIDELAGVAAFDRKIIQAKEKLDAVKEREEKARIVEKELMTQRDRLSQDRIKAEKYKKLRQELEAKSQWEAVIHYRQLVQRTEELTQQIQTGDRSLTDLATQLATLTTEIQQAATELETLNIQVKALGEEELLALQATLATREAEQRQLQRQEQELTKASQDLTQQLQQAQQEIQTHLKALETLAQEDQTIAGQLDTLMVERDEAQQILEQNREQASAIASASEAWVQQQTALRAQMESLLQTLEPQRTEQTLLQERRQQLDRLTQEQTQTLQTLDQEISQYQTQQAKLEKQVATEQTQVQAIAQSLAQAEQNLQIQQDTQNRLLKEQRDKQRQLDKLEAQVQAMQETQGTFATRLILQSDIPGVCGLVAQLGNVEPRYQLALETAAGARLGHLVVEDDAIAQTAIELLKQRKAGRATFLPLNKIQPPRTPNVPNWQRIDGLIDWAINLIDCDPRYEDVFAYVFGGTLVFTTLSDARRYLGQFRMVTLDGELLEPSGAMSGGSSDSRYSIHFGTVDTSESVEVTSLKTRLRDIETLLNRTQREIAQLTATVKQQTQALSEARQQHREAQLQAQQVQATLQRLTQQQTQVRSQLTQQTQELTIAQDRLKALSKTLPTQEAQLQSLRQALGELEQSQTHREWQQIQTQIRTLEATLQERELTLRNATQRLQELDNQRHRLQEKIQQSQNRVQSSEQQQATQQVQKNELQQQLTAVQTQISEIQAELAKLDQRLGTAKQNRDRLERHLRDQQTQQQQLDWQQQKLQETQQTRRSELLTQQQQLTELQAELPDPLPEIPADLGLEQLQQDLRSLSKRIQSMEPVNMLALEEYERTQERLQELSQKLAILDEERTELLLRIENFTTLRQRAFKEAFDAVNENFQSIFATLSDGDGYLQLDDPQDPFSSGLNLVAHPKGKPVQRLASMSGGEKSLTALSFIFALQRYRPSPFYAFDEVDMFLDGANVERLARMIRQQAQQAQFIVVSLRRPMIESAERTIGVTQARGAYTQVLGITLQPQSASV